VTLHDYLEELASAAPTPGGGGAAAAVAALGAALVAMVARITRANAAHAAHHALADAVVLEADAAREAALMARERDEAAYADVARTMALPKTSVAEKAVRTARLQTALEAAAAAPLVTAGLATRVAVLSERALGLENPHLVSDLGCAAEFAAAALAAAAWNVRVNHKFMKDPSAIDRQASELAGYEREAAPPITRVRSQTARVLER
jgi:formiminotetrahydrofolate cyclodeaminase